MQQKVKMNTIKFKNRNIALAILLALCSCNNDTITEEKQYAKIEFKTRIKIDDFSIKTKSTTEELAASCKSIDFYDYINGILKNEIHQKNTDQNFGNISNLLEYGDHDCYIVGHNSTTITPNAGMFEFDKVTDTFLWHEKLTINSSYTPTVNASLSRCVGKIEIEAIDAIPNNASYIVINVSGYSGKMIMDTGLGDNVLTSTTRTFNYSEAQKGMKNTVYSIYSFIPNDTYNIAITIKIYDANNNELNVVTINNAPVYLNKITHYSGNLFSLSESFTLNINNTWLDTINFNF